MASNSHISTCLHVDIYKPWGYLHMKGSSTTPPLLGFPTTSDSLISFVSSTVFLCFITDSLAAAWSGDQLGRVEHNYISRATKGT